MPSAAVPLRDRRAQEAELAHLREDLGVDLAARRPTPGCWAGSRASTKARAVSRTSRFSSVRVKSITVMASTRVRGWSPAMLLPPRPIRPGPGSRTTRSLYSARGHQRRRPTPSTSPPSPGPTCRRSWAGTWSAAGPTGSATACTTRAAAAYLDFANGIAVTALGHAHPRVTAAIHAQVDRLIGPVHAIGFAESDGPPGPDARGHVPRPAGHRPVPELRLGGHRRRASSSPAA